MHVGAMEPDLAPWKKNSSYKARLQPGKIQQSLFIDTGFRDSLYIDGSIEYIYIYVCVYVYIYIYIYLISTSFSLHIHREGTKMLFCQGHGISCAGRSGTTHRTVTRQGAMMTPPGRVETP